MPWRPEDELKRREAERDLDFCSDARRSSTVLIQGDGLPTKVGIGASDLPFETWLSLQNRDLPAAGPQYDQVSRVRSGMLLLHTNPIQGRDQVYRAQMGLTLGQGTMAPDAVVPAGKLEITEGPPPLYTYGWQVVGSQGRSAILTLGIDINSREVVNLLAKVMKGEYHVERIDAATITAAPNMVVPGWKLLLAPTWRPGQDLDLPEEAPRMGR